MSSHTQRIAELEVELEETYRSITEITNSLDVARENATTKLKIELDETYRSVAQLTLSLELAKERIADRNTELDTAVSALESFNYSVSHDLRAPLRGISAFAQALEEDCGPQLDETGLDYISRICAASSKMDHLIVSLLKFSRFSRQPVDSFEINLSDIVLPIFNEFCEQDPSRKVQFVVAPDLIAVADLNLIRIVLQNLIGNAWKYTGNEVEALIEFGMLQDAEQPTFYVRDNGVGFNMATADKLFEPFQRFHSAKDFEGTGIGLATVSQIVKRHGGTVWAESEPGMGTTIFFTLPPKAKSEEHAEDSSLLI